MVRIPKARRKMVTLRFRATAEQRDALFAAAQRDELPFSTWIRRLALREAGWKPAAVSARR